MASSKIFIFFSLLAIGLLIPSEVAAISPGWNEDPQTLADQNVAPISMRFDVGGATINNYNTFIQTIRNNLRQSISHGIPVLKPQPRTVTPTTVTWLEIELVTNGRSVTLMFQQGNLYLVGYKRSSDSHYWEFSDSKLIKDSKSIGFTGSYTGANGLQTKAGVTREVLPLGSQAFINAVNKLAGLQTPIGGNNVQDAARSLLVFTQMIPEAARFKAISEFIATNWFVQNGVVLSSQMLGMENNWGQLSDAVQQIDRTPTPTTPLPGIPSNHPSQVLTLGQAVAAIGIMLYRTP